MNVCITFCELKILRCMDQQNAVSTKTHQTNGQWYIQLPCCELFQLYSLFFCVLCWRAPPSAVTLCQMPSASERISSPTVYRRWQHPLHSDVCIGAVIGLNWNRSTLSSTESFPYGRFYLKLIACVAFRWLFILTLLFTCQCDQLADFVHLATCHPLFPRYFVKQDKKKIKRDLVRLD